MDKEQIWITRNFEPIPRVFWSDLTGKPFERCIQCNRYLLEDGVGYFVEKAFQKYKGKKITSTVFEYAMCYGCRDELSEVFSTETKERIDAFLGPYFDRNKRLKELDVNATVEDRIRHCIVDKEEASEAGSYQIMAQCDGSDILLDLMPMMIRGEVMDRIVDLISDKSMDEFNRFMDQNFTGPPEFKEILSNGPRVLI